MQPEHETANRIAKQAHEMGWRFRWLNSVVAIGQKGQGDYSDLFKKQGALKVHPGGWVEYSGEVPDEIRELAESEAAKMRGEG